MEVGESFEALQGRKGDIVAGSEASGRHAQRDDGAGGERGHRISVYDERP